METRLRNLPGFLFWFRLARYGVTCCNRGQTREICKNKKNTLNKGKVVIFSFQILIFQYQYPVDLLNFLEPYLKPDFLSIWKWEMWTCWYHFSEQFRPGTKNLINTKGNPLCERYENTFYISSTSNDLLMNEISRSSVSLTDLNFDAWFMLSVHKKRVVC